MMPIPSFASKCWKELLAERGDLNSLRKAVADRNRDVREVAVGLLVNATVSINRCNCSSPALTLSSLHAG